MLQKSFFTERFGKDILDLATECQIKLAVAHPMIRLLVSLRCGIMTLPCQKIDFLHLKGVLVDSKGISPAEAKRGVQGGSSRRLPTWDCQVCVGHAW